MTKDQTTLPLNYYLVGGAVRDRLLKREIVERDYVVIGSTVDKMLSLGFTQVGRDFPVFLHPKSKEEYALARTEKKQGHGYTGFICNASPDVTLEQDLMRRDLTVNAMALDSRGNIIDPYNGQADIKNRCLRHVSDAFLEDPLRVLRVARFAARYHYLGFTVAPQTMTLMSTISQSGELTELSAERIWQEFAKSFAEDHPNVFIDVLYQCGALKSIWPSLQEVWANSTLREQALLNLTQTCLASEKVSIRFSALCIFLGKSASLNPRVNNDIAHVALVEDICTRLKIPLVVKSLAIKTCRFHLTVRDIKTLDARQILNLFNQIDIWRKPDEFEDLLQSCKSYIDSSSNHVTTSPTQIILLKKLAGITNEITAKKFVSQGIKGKAIKEAIETDRVTAIDNFLTQDR